MNTETAGRGQERSPLTRCQPQLTLAALELTDAVRRCAGYALDAAGLGPVETEWRPAVITSGFTLREYQPVEGRGAAILLVPAPIKRPYIWDVSPNASVVRRCLIAGLRVYLVDWARAPSRSVGAGLSHYADRYLKRCLAGINSEAAGAPVFLAGHSLGGTLAAIFVALQPRRISGLILLDAPLHFGPDVAPLDALAATAPPVALPESQRVPGSMLDLAAVCAAPGEFAVSRGIDFVSSLARRDALLTHLRVERWSLDESAMPRRLFEQFVDSLHRRDAFMRRRLIINGRLADPQNLTMPLLIALSRHSSVVPSESVLPFLQQLRRRPKLLWYDGDIGVSLSHLGMLVGRSAHRFLWPRIVQWIQGQAKRRAA